MSSATELTTMNVSLPRSQKLWVERQCVKTGCSTASEYIRRLIHDDQVRREREALDQRLAEILRSGPASEMTSRDWDTIRAAARARLNERKRKR